MKLTELNKLLKAGEWNDIEFKEARTDVPKSAFETVSAFANTHGRRLVFGDDSRLWEPGEKEVRNPSIAMAMRRIAMCEQAGTGLRMMREAWRKLGHPSPTYKNDRAGKAFELFIPELDKEVDMASDLVKAMFGTKTLPQAKGQSEAPVEAPVKAPVTLFATDRSIMNALLAGERGRSDLLKVLGHKHRSGNFKQSIDKLLHHRFIEYTIPDKPNSRLQKYRLTDKGRQALSIDKENAK